MYYTNSTCTFQAELLIQHGDVHPNPGPSQDNSSDIREIRIPLANHGCKVLSGGRITYSSADLLRYSTMLQCLGKEVWSTIKSFGISSKPPTHRGVKAGRRIQSRRRELATCTFSGKGDDQLQLSNFALWNARSVKNKTHVISDRVSSHHTDVLVITETWLTGDARDAS